MKDFVFVRIQQAGFHLFILCLVSYNKLKLKEKCAATLLSHEMKPREREMPEPSVEHECLINDKRR